MKMKRIANNVALQTIGYVISGFTNVYIYVRECGYQKRDIYRGLYKHFAHDEMNKYAYCKITELDGEENVGRVLPAEYCFFTGDGRRNHFTTEWKSTDCFGWTLESPYTD